MESPHETPHESSVRWLIGRYAGLRARHGEAVGTPDLVEPTSRFFPDPFALDADSVAKLLTRVLSYAPVSDELTVALRFVEAGEATGGCGSQSCCDVSDHGPNSPRDRVLDMGDGYIVELPTSDVGHPVLLTTALARAAGTIVLIEAMEPFDPAHAGAMSELAASFCGFGVLLTNGAHIYGKSCGGVSVRRHTHLTVAEHALLLAMFCALHDIKPSAARANLEPTPREAFAGARAWMDARPRLLAELREQPELLKDGVLPDEAPKGALGALARILAG